MKQIVGHAFQKNFLITALKKGTLSHACLFAGPEGVGKKMIAEFLAHELLKEDGFDKEDLSSHPNVRLLGYDGEISIDAIRDLKKFFHMTPFQGARRIVCINDAHGLNKEAANSFLKLLEEPPANSYFFLITHAPLNLPQTIVSRCAVIRFSQVSKRELESWMISSTKVPSKEREAALSYASGSPARILLWNEDIKEKIKKMGMVMANKSVFQWDEWDKEPIEILAESCAHYEMFEQSNEEFSDFLQRVKRVLDVEIMLKSTNVNKRLAWENAFWQ